MMEGTKVPQIRRDWVTKRWVIFSPARAKRPSDLKSKSPVTDSDDAHQSCPFCLGREHLCAPEIFRLPPDHPDWKLRVIQNLYPALSRDVTPPPPSEADADLVMTGFGFHDVVIESPLHSLHLSHLPPSHVGDVLLAYVTRIHQLFTYPSIQYVQVFKNHGASAGASMSHSHSQMMALPFVPPAVAARLDSMKDHFNQTGKCSVCESLDTNADLLIHRSAHFVSVVPYAASFPFEMWIIPLTHSPHFHELDADKAVDLGGILKLMLGKMALQLNNPPYNFMIQTSPLRDTASDLPHSHWFLQIIPQLGVQAGFEIGTGCYINPVFPEDAAKVLREVNVPPTEADNQNKPLA